MQTLKKGEFRVFYSAKNMRAKTRRELESKIEELANSFGYSQWAAGMDMTTRVRDLAFDRG